MACESESPDQAFLTIRWRVVCEAGSTLRGKGALVAEELIGILG